MEKSVFYEIGKHGMSMFTRVNNMVIVMLVLMAFSGSFLEASETKTLQAAIMDFPPLGYEKNGNIDGLTAQLIRAISKESGVPIRLTLRPYFRIKVELREGETDVAILHYTEDEKKIATALGELSRFQNVVVARKGIQYTSFADLHGKVVVKVRGANYDDRLEKNDAIEIHEVNTYQHAIKMLFAGRVDAFGSDIVIYDAARKLGFTKEDFSEKYVLMNPGNVYLVFSNKHLEDKHEEVKKLERALKRLKDEGVIDRIMDSYIK